MPRSKSRRTRRNRRRRGGKTEKPKPIAPNTAPFAGNLVDPDWITADHHLTNLTTPGGCAMMLGKRGTLWGRSGMGGEYGKIAASKMTGYDGTTNNKVAMMNFNLGCDKGNGENQVIFAFENMDDELRRKRFGINNENIANKDLYEKFKSFDWLKRKEFLEKGTEHAKDEWRKFKNFATPLTPLATAEGGRRRRRKRSRKKRRKSRRKSRRNRKKSRKRRRRR